MKNYIGVKNGKVWDVCSTLLNKRDNSIKDEDYIESDISMGDVIAGDTWNDGNPIKDSPLRSVVPEKTVQELKNNELQAKIDALENRIKDLEGK